jgi:hypothetical protein
MNLHVVSAVLQAHTCGWVGGAGLQLYQIKNIGPYFLNWLSEVRNMKLYLCVYKFCFEQCYFIVIFM